jgi:putative aldouronate transport system substrate-binding protein
MATSQLTLNRRRLIMAAAGGAALPLLAACSSGAPAAPAAPPSGGSGAAAQQASALPNFIANTTGPKPDFPAAGPQYQDGFINYPKNPSKALPPTPPGAGGKVLCYTNNSAPAPPTPLEQNQAWQETNKQLNADVSFTIIAQSDYITKLATVMAGNDLPDVMLIPGNTNSGAAQVQNLTQFLQAKAADLTPYLAGDAAREYPNLAAIPTYSWLNSGCARGGKLYMLPIERYYPGSMLLKNSAIYDAALGKDYVPKNADDFKRVLQQLNRPNDNQWAIGAYQNQMYYIYYFAAMFGAPNNWSLDNGKLTRDIETPQYREAVGYVRDLVASGLYHPDALTIADSTRARDAFIGSKFALDVETFGNAWQDAWTRGPKLSPPVTPQAVLPFPAHDGGKARHYLGKGYFGTTVFKSASAERTKELLRIANWLAAPFGSAEDLLLTVGVKDVDYTVDSNGSITVLPASNTDANSVPWKYIVQRPQVAFWPGVPDYAKAATDFEKAAISVGVSDPTLGFASATLDTKGVPLFQTLTDGITDVLAGRRPLTDFDQIVKDWQNNGGNTIRTELEQSIAAAKG